MGERSSLPRLATRLLVMVGLAMLVTSPAYSETCRSQDGTLFPLAARSGQRYLEDAAGRPFFLQGDAAWSLIAQLTREDADLYLRDRRSRGFNAILVNVLEHRFASNAPANAYGNDPFEVPGDFGTPNEAYFEHVDWIVRRACELGLLLVLAPAYTGNGGGPEGWYQEMVASGAAKLHDYGKFLGARYRGMGNILWLAAGDYNPPDKSLARAVVLGIKEVDPGALHTAHGSPGTAALDYWGPEPWLAINTLYSYEPVHLTALAQYEQNSSMPTILLESSYENEHRAGEHRLRMQAYQAVLSGATGQIFGNNPIWHFDGPGLFPAPTGWREALGSRGAQSMTILHELISSVKWWELVPDVENELLTSGRGSDEARSVAAVTADRESALVYMPTSRSVVLDLSRMDGEAVSARWFDPSDGSERPVEGSPLPREPVTLTPPPRNHAGFTDWVLVLSTQSGSGSR